MSWGLVLGGGEGGRTLWVRAIREGARLADLPHATWLLAEPVRFEQ